MDAKEFKNQLHSIIFKCQQSGISIWGVHEEILKSGIIEAYAQQSRLPSYEGFNLYFDLRNYIDKIIRENVYMDKRGIPIIQGRLKSADLIIEWLKQHLTESKQEEGEEKKEWHQNYCKSCNEPMSQNCPRCKKLWES